MLECAKIKSPCVVRVEPEPCPVAPPRPFPWVYVWATLGTLAMFQMIYRMYLWMEERMKAAKLGEVWRPRPPMRRPFYAEDLPPCVQYLIIGTGPAGIAAYNAITQNDPGAKVFFITQEDICPYERWPMSTFFWWNKKPPNLKNLQYLVDNDINQVDSLFEMQCTEFMDPVKFYRREQGPAVSIATGWCVSRIDPDQHKVFIHTVCGERPMYYQRCLIAPGSRPRNLDIFEIAPKPVREKITTFRTIRDLEASFRAVQKAQHVTILGGGPLGCELAWHIGARKKIVEEEPEDECAPLEVAHVYRGKGVLGSLLPAYLGEWLAEKIHCQGVQQYSNREVYDVNMTPDQRLELTMSDGSTLITDYVIVAIGASPREDLAENSCLELDEENGGILTNTELEARTHLYVAGDAASVYSQWKNARVRFENLNNAVQLGRQAGLNMTGYWIPNNDERHFQFRLGKDIDVEAIGDVRGSMQTIALFKQCLEDEDAQRYDLITRDNELPCYKDSVEYKHRYKRGILFYMDGETVVGMLFWNVPAIDDRKDVVTEILRAEPSYKDINTIAELVQFPETQCTYLPERRALRPAQCGASKR